MNEEQFEECFKRLKEALGVRNASELAKALRISHQGVSSARQRRQIPMSWLRYAAESEGVSIDWLLYGRGGMRRESGPRRVEAETGGPARADHSGREPESSGYGTPRVFQAGEVVVPPRVEPRLLRDSLLFEESPEQPGVCFQHFWLSRLGTIASMAVMPMHGRHMEPSLVRGDLLLLDRSQTEIIPGSVYAVAMGEEVVIKRLERLPGELVLGNDNPDCEDVRVPYPSDDLRVLARVVWSGRCLA
ncbi:LexA family transcriptional regulator [Desulfohalovibrio reitneri]|uniref:LexA family transcriptional regulator n=1 Tax=Desulfohalovibrio reitneri TaxID=1307759 RepID=UPI001F009D66|nr:S24 family peptidase [Desulfohalovibrio reitneri]